MISKIYFGLSRWFFSRIVKNVGKNSELRFSSRIIEGKYVTIGGDTKISQNWLIAVYPEFGGQDNPVKSNNKGVIIEDGVSVNRNLTIYCSEEVRIGKNCMLGSNILITDNDHGIDAENEFYSQQPLISKPTIIEEECWIAQNCCILSGSHIGKRSIIGAGSIVRGSIPPYSIAVGCPAKVIKQWDFEHHIWRRVGE